MKPRSGGVFGPEMGEGGGGPWFTVVAASVLALGVGATSAIFSVLSSVVLRPAPFQDDDRGVTLAWNYGALRPASSGVSQGLVLAGAHPHLRRCLFADVQALLTAPVLAEMAVTVSDEPIEVAVPEILITDDGARSSTGPCRRLRVAPMTEPARRNLGDDHPKAEPRTALGDRTLHRRCKHGEGR
ncbi:MAG: hypothetical protein OXF01_16470 [Gemmatimonadetes bacterium]|nr:hypothetical protein [Gemmatimonadota bacterium]